MKLYRNPTVFSKKVNGRWYLLEPKEGAVRELNETAGVIWERVKNPVSREFLVQHLTTLYDKPRKECAKDVNEFVSKYLKAGLLVRS